MTTRRQFIQGAGAGALLLTSGGLARGAGAFLGPGREFQTARESVLFPALTLVHADLHNHTLLSDGAGNAENAFGSMRAAGLDVAALTDHATVSKGSTTSPCSGEVPCSSLGGLNDLTWEQVRSLANTANVDDVFTAIRGFEWSSPTLGHINVWFSENYTDPLHTAGLGHGEGGATWATEQSDGTPPAGTSAQIDALMRANPAGGEGMALFYEWLGAAPTRPVHGGGIDGLCGFNHPGREPGRFQYFDPRIADLAGVRNRVVSLELFNRREDYLFEGTDVGQPSPLVDCLDKGWRVGILGVTDEHATDWGVPDGKGRTGLWVTEQTRSGVREAMLARRFFATNQRGLRVAALCNKVPMGSTVAGVGSTATITLDIDRGNAWNGKQLDVQVLASGYPMPIVLSNTRITVAGSGTPIDIETPVGADDQWIVVRISDPSVVADKRADSTYRGFGQAVAYASPFYLLR